MPKRVCKRKIRHGSCRVVTTRKHKVRGGSLFSWIKKKALPWVRKKALPWARKKALPWLKKNKAISKSANLLGSFGIPYAGLVGKAAGATGYGLNRSGGSLNRTGRRGGGRRMYRRRKKKA